MSIRIQTRLSYDPVALDLKWQDRWEADGLYRVVSDDPRPKWYALTMFPYTSGDLHVGHWYAVVPSDAHARFMRMRGYNVLHPMGFDAFGLPAENAAITRGIHPHMWTMRNVEKMRAQLRSVGAVYDWDREVITCDPAYYRWNQWFFLQMYQRGLAYRALAPVNWCPGCQTVLANEQVIDGRCERSGDLVQHRQMEQWFFRITAYAEELLDFSGVVAWPDRVLLMQQNWIGKSHGVEVGFDISTYGLAQKEIRTFTTRIDTVFGVTFLALAPEHPLVPQLTTPPHEIEVRGYVAETQRVTEIERLSTERRRSGVFTGSYAVNRLNGERVPILVADYVLLSYGTGAVMGVPAHDHRDFELAGRYGLDVRVVVAPPDWNEGDTLTEAYVERRAAKQINSCRFSGMANDVAYQAIADEIEHNGWGRRMTSYRMRDWLVSRQRYWGTPIPIVYCESCGVVPVPESQLPVLLPEDAEFRPTGESPLRLHQGFLQTTCPRCAGPALRETDTMDTFVDSSWYFLRYLSPHSSRAPVEPEEMRAWGPVDQYTGGAEHAVMHLLYARFFTRVLRDIGVADYGEPFLRLFNQGVILSQSGKMSKSKGNVIAPDDYLGSLGADVVRLYLMFVGPWDSGGEWSDTGINGIARWTSRVWELCLRDGSGLPERDADRDRAVARRLHQTIRRVVMDLERFKFNTAIAALMELTNELSPAYEASGVSRRVWRDAVRALLLLLAPLAPHIAEELWERNGWPYSIHQQLLPVWDETLAASEEATLVVQVDGKVRDRITISVGIGEDEAKARALASERVLAYTRGAQPAMIVYVPGRHLVSIATKSPNRPGA